MRGVVKKSVAGGVYGLGAYGAYLDFLFLLFLSFLTCHFLTHFLSQFFFLCHLSLCSFRGVSWWRVVVVWDLSFGDISCIIERCAL